MHVCRSIADFTRVLYVKHSVVGFARSLYATHPELEKPVRWRHFLRMADRSRVAIRVVALSRPARLIRYDDALCIRINHALSYHLRTLYGVHELCHVWRDEPGSACIYADEETVTKDPNEDFADLFAWYVTSEAGFYQRPLADRRIPPGTWQVKLKELERAGYDDRALAVASSQDEDRIRRWKAGKGMPDVVTGRIFSRMLASIRKGSAS
ncbi:MAG TPA: hypothetical protein VNO75_12315 [Gemmatimonadaceae bacterium]|nr:hypothetical protein [Gemmatimonadaceae bacterium]